MTISSECALCDIKITKDNDTKEHIIPNAIGGRKKITGFICKNCNHKSGDEWESDLARQLNPLSLFFGINRDRGKVPSQVFETTGGEKFKLNAEGSMDIEKPDYQENQCSTGVSISINARSMKEANSMLKGVKRKFPQVDLDEIIGDAQVKSSYCSDMLKFNLSFGGQKAGRSIVKSAMALAVKSGVDPKKCEHAREYLLNEDGEACFGYYYEKDLIVNRPDGIPLHCVSVKNNPETKQLIAYVEYYGIQRMVLCLSSLYDGSNISETYAINPIDSSILELVINLNLTGDDIYSAYAYKKIPQGAVEEAFSNVIPTGIQLSIEKEKDRVLERTVKHAFTNCGAKEGEKLTEEHINNVVALVAEGLEPFLIHQFSMSRKKKE